MKGARFDERAMRCAQRLRVGLEPAPATLSLIESVGEPRLKLDVNWDPETIPAFLALPACEAHGRSLPVDPYLLEPLEHYLRTFGVEVGPNAADVLERLRAEHDAAIVDVRRSRAHDGPALAVEDVLGGELRPFQRAGVAYALKARRTFLADEQGLGKTVQALAALEADDAYPAVVVCPASLKLNWQRETERWLPERSITVVSGTGATPKLADITILNYDIVHAHRARLSLAQPKRARARRVALRQEPARQAHARGAPARRRAARGRAAPRADRHAGDEPPRRADRAAAGARPARGVRLGRALLAPLPGRRGGGAHPLAPAPHLLRAAGEGRRAAAAPRKRQVVVPVALENEREYRLAEQDVIAWLREQPLDLSELDRRVAAALRAERLAQLNALKRLAARGKLGPALAWIDDFLASDEPLVVFWGHREVQDLVIERFPNAAHLLGRDSTQAREDAVQAFQEPGGPR